MIGTIKIIIKKNLNKKMVDKLIFFRLRAILIFKMIQITKKIFFYRHLYSYNFKSQIKEFRKNNKLSIYIFYFSKYFCTFKQINFSIKLFEKYYLKKPIESFILFNKMDYYNNAKTTKTNYIDNYINYKISKKKFLIKSKLDNPTKKRFKQNILIKQFNNEYNINENIKNLDKNFLKLIENKKIALVGPSPQEDFLPNGPEIDSYDLVARTNFNSEQKLSKKFYGSKTNISYYNNHFLMNYIHKLNDIDKNIFLSFKDITFVNNLRNNNFKVKETFTLDFFYYNGISQTALNSIIFDLLNYNPKKIKVFNFSFYYGNNTYENTYKSIDRKYSFIDISKELRKHSAQKNIDIFKNFLQNDRVYVDESLQKIINLSESIYINNLDKKFGKYSFTN